MTEAEDKRAKPPPECVGNDAPRKDKPVNPIRTRRGFLAGRISVPDDFDTMMQDEIERMFYGED